MHHYGAKEVEKLLRLPRSTISALIKAGFVTPERGPRNSWRFSFQDMIVLRTAQALTEAKVPARRITRSLQQLRRQLPESMPLSGLSISAVGDQVVVRDGAAQRQVETGQYLLAFEGDPQAGRLSVVEAHPAQKRPAARAQDSAQDWFDQAVELEVDDPQGSIKAYERSITLDPDHLAARVNLGRLLHEAGQLQQAETVYRQAIAACGEDALLLYNLAVVLEDAGRIGEALQTYEAALRNDPGFADCCYNLALLCKRLDRPREAIRYMSQYRRLVGVAGE